MAGQGLVYVKVKQGYEFTYDSDNDADLLKSYMEPEIETVNVDETKAAASASAGTSHFDTKQLTEEYPEPTKMQANQEELRKCRPTRKSLQPVPVLLFLS